MPQSPSPSPPAIVIPADLMESRRNVAGTALGAAALFLTIVAVLINSAALFFMATALIATIGASRLQAYLSVRGLTFERQAPDSVKVGDLVTIKITVWSHNKVPRPLVTIRDNLPPPLLHTGLTPSLPIAPAFERPIETQYQFRPLRRGKYRWSGLTVVGTDALGLVTTRKTYETTPAQMTVLPIPVPVALDLPPSAGWGISENASGKARGGGIEPRGIREYTSGDSLRHVHWRSSARSRQLLVKEFEAGSNSAAAFIIQRTHGTEIGEGAITTLEAMCSHAAFLSELFLRQGARVEYPALEEPSRTFAAQERLDEILDLLAGVQTDVTHTVGEEASEYSGKLPFGSTLFAMLSLADPTLPQAARTLQVQGTSVVALLYDAAAYAKGGRFAGRSALDPAFLDELRNAGVHTVVVPRDN